MKHFLVLPVGEFYKQGLDISDAAIAFYIKETCASNNPKIEQQRDIGKNGRKMTWIGFQHLIDDMPYLNISSRMGITKRVKKLIKAGFIKTEMGENRHLLFYATAKLTDLFIDRKS